MKRYVIYVILLVGAYVLGVYSGPAIYNKSEVLDQTKVVQTDKNIKKDEVINETIIERPDGTIETKRRTTTGTIEVSKVKEKDRLKSVKTEHSESLPSNQITLMYSPSSIPEYGVMYQRRIFSSLYVGGYVMNNEVTPQFGLSVTLGF